MLSYNSELNLQNQHELKPFYYKFICLLLMELEQEVEDVNGNEICTDRTLWDTLYERSAPQQLLLFVCLFFVSYIG